MMTKTDPVSATLCLKNNTASKMTTVFKTR